MNRMTLPAAAWTTMVVLLRACTALAGENAPPVLSNHEKLFPPDRACTVTSSREPLLHYTRKEWQKVPEGRRLILDADSHPRQPASFASAPSVRKTDTGYEISFALTGFDDVDVRIVNDAGSVVRRLGCGVLGPNAPSPFAGNSLSQTIVWDGLDAAGNPAGDGCRAVVSVGLRPRFDGFVGYDRTSVVPNIVAMEVDPKGRLYVATSVENRGDPVMVRFDRQGAYLDMVYPPSPRRLAGRKLEDLYRHAEYLEGRPVPTRARSWTQYVYQWPAGTIFPFRIDADGTGYVAEILTGHGSADVDWDTTQYRLFRIDDMENFWFLQNITLLQSYAAFALDGKGCGYLAGRRFAISKGTASTDQSGIGRIRKVDLATGEPRADFLWNGSEKLEKPSSYLGTALEKKLKGNERLPRNTAGNAEIDSENRFADICDVDIDAQGRILVTDSIPRRVKVYEPNGKFLGMLERLTVDGEEKEFAALHALEQAGDDTYLIASLRTPPAPAEPTGAGEDGTKAPKHTRPRPGPLCVLKCTGDILSPALAWKVETHKDAHLLAVDRSAEPRILWIGNGNGLGTFSRIVDNGNAPGDAAHFGGTKERHFRSPVSFSIDGEGRLFVFDYISGSIVRTDDATTHWKETRPWKGDRAPATPRKGPTLFVDRVGNRLFSTSHGQPPRYYTLDLERIEDFALRMPVDREGTFAWVAKSGGVIGGVDRRGNLYVSDGPYTKKRPKRKPGEKPPEEPAPPEEPVPPKSLTGAVRRYGPDGSITDRALARITWGAGSMAIDSKGNMYVLDLAGAEQWTYVSHNIPCGLCREDPKISGGRGPARLMFTRGGLPVWQQSDLCYLVKFGPEGGWRHTEEELWAHRGFSPHPGGGCSCDWPRVIVAVDDADRIFAADSIHHHVKVLDTEGNLVARIGWWGNADDVPDDGDVSKLGFWNIYALATFGETLYVGDKDLRRIARIVMAYRETAGVAVDLPQ